MTVQNQALSSADGVLYSWVTASPDWAASSFPGPGSALHIAVSMAPATPGSGGGVTDHGALTGLTDVADHAWAELAQRPQSSYTASSNDAVLADVRKCIITTRATAISLRIRLQASISWIADSLLGGINTGAGTLTITAEGGVTLNGSVTVPQNGWWWAKRTALNTWQVFTGGTGSGGGTGDFLADGSVPATGDFDLDGNAVGAVSRITYELYDGYGNSGSSKTIVAANGDLQRLLLTADCAVTVTPGSAPCSWTVLYTQNGTGGWGITHSGVTLLSSEDIAQAAGAVTVVNYLFDGTTTRVAVAGAGLTGPGSSVDDRIATWNGTGGDDLQDGGQTIAQVIAAGAAAAPQGDLKANGTVALTADWAVGAFALSTTSALIVNTGSGFIRVGLVAGSGSGVASAAASGLLRMPRGNNILLGLRDDGDTADYEGVRWNSSSGALTLGSTNTQTRMNAGTLVSLQIGGTDRFYVTSTRCESTLSFYFKDTVAAGVFGQVAQTGSTAGKRVTYSGNDTANGAAGPARVLGGSASGSGAGGDVELIPGTSGSSTAGNLVEGTVPSSYNSMQFGKFVGVAIAIPTAKPSTSGRYVYNVSGVGWVTWSSNGIVASLAPGASAALVNSKTQALIGVTGAAGQATTNATPALVSIVDLSAPGFAGAIDNAGVTVTLNAECVVRSGTDVASIRIRRRFKRMSGTITAGAAATSLFSDIDAGIAGTVAIDLTFSDNVIQASVTGKAATNLDWVLSWSIDSTGV